MPADPAGRSQRPGGTCATLADALAGSLYVVAVNGPEDVEVHGVVPDGIDFVELRYADGTATRLRVTDNYYYVHARKATTSIAVTGPDGVERIWPATAGVA